MLTRKLTIYKARNGLVLSAVLYITRLCSVK